MLVQITFRSAKMVECRPFWNERLTRLTMHSLCIMYICNLRVHRYGFAGSFGSDWTVSDHCLLLTSKYAVETLPRNLILTVKGQTYKCAVLPILISPELSKCGS